MPYRAGDWADGRWETSASPGRRTACKRGAGKHRIDYLDLVLGFRCEFRIERHLLDDVEANHLSVEIAFEILILARAILHVEADFFHDLDASPVGTSSRHRRRSFLLPEWRISVDFRSPALYPWESPNSLDCRSRRQAESARRSDR